MVATQCLEIVYDELCWGGFIRDLKVIHFHCT